MTNRHTRRPVGGDRVFVRLISHHDDRRDAFGSNLTRNGCGVERAVMRLTTGHGDRIIEQNLVGHIDLGRSSRAYREQARVIVGTVTDIGEHMLLGGEGRVTDPGRALGTHVREGRGRAIHPQGHVVATNTSECATAFGHARGGIVRTARAEVRGTVCLRIRAGADFKHRFARLEISNALAHTLLDRMTGKVCRDACRNRTRNLRWVQFIRAGQQPFTMAGAARIAPFTGVIKFTDDAGPHIIAPVIEFFLELIFKQLTFFFHNQNFFQTRSKRARAFGFEWPAHAHFVETQANVARDGFGDAQIIQRLTGVEIRFAGGHDAETRVRTVPDHAVELVGACIGQRCIPFVINQPRFLFEHAIGPANIEATGRHIEVFGQGDFHAPGINIDGRTRLDHIGDAFHRDPQTGVTAHRKTMQAVIQIFLHR